MKRRIPIAVFAIAALAAAGCKKAEPTPASVSNSARPLDPFEITVTPELAKQITIGEPSWAGVSEELRVAGRVQADETRIANVSSPVAGRIVELNVLEGQEVRKGQVLAVIHTTRLSDAQSAYLKALSQRALTERAVERAKRLLAADVIGTAELQRREAELAQAGIDAAASRDELLVLGMPEEAVKKLEATRTLNTRAEVAAPIDGTVLERKVTMGQIVDEATIVCSIADLSQVWLVADVPEQAAAALRPGKYVHAEIAALPGLEIQGRLTFVSATVNPETRTVSTRMTLSNANRRFKPAMLATMHIQEEPVRQKVVPAKAIVRDGDKEYVFVRKSENVFLLKPVTLGGEVGDKRVVVTGLDDGVEIVVDGAFHLNNERKRLALQAS